jgi:hypothetical protein
VSEDSVRRAPVSGDSCQGEAELARCGPVESRLVSKPGSNFALQTAWFDGSLPQDPKYQFRLAHAMRRVDASSIIPSRAKTVREPKC